MKVSFIIVSPQQACIPAIFVLLFCQRTMWTTNSILNRSSMGTPDVKPLNALIKSVHKLCHALHVGTMLG